MEGTREQVLARIEEFRLARSMSESAFGLAAVGDNKFIPRLRKGRATLRLIERAETFMRGQTLPKGTAIPSGH
jgi:hypothetical protein